MEEQANVQLRPGASREKRRVSELIKRIPAISLEEHRRGARPGNSDVWQKSQKSYSTVATNVIPSSMITHPRVELSPVAGQLHTRFAAAGSEYFDVGLL